MTIITGAGDRVPDSEGGKYQISEILKVIWPHNTNYPVTIEYMDNQTKTSSWGAVDGMLIDEDMLYLEDEEADKLYQELKTRSFRRRNMEEKENRLTMAMNKEDEIEEEQTA